MRVLEERDPFGMVAMALGGWAYACALRRDVSRAENLLDRFEHTDRDNRAAFWVGRTRARLTALEGDTQAGADIARRSGSKAVDGGLLVPGCFLLHEAVRFGHPSQVVGPLTAVAAGVDGDLIPLFPRHARHLDAGDGEALDRVAASYRDMGAQLYAAEAAAQAAACHREAGRPQQARRSRGMAARLVAACEDAWTPVFAAPDTDLTDREREVATLAAEGLSNQEIAGRLTISPRTVENHLHRVYGKVGIDGRDELPGVIGLRP